MSIKNISVIGLGTMGKGIIQTFAKHNYKITGINLNSNTFDKNVTNVISLLDKYNINNKKIEFSTDISKIKESDLIIECIKEDKNEKIELYKKINKHTSDKSIVATNTSSLSLNDLQNHIDLKQNFIGMHFFNPVPKMKLVEIIKNDNTDKMIVNKVINLINNINYKPIICKDSPGFIVNKLLIPQIIQAIHLYSKNIASIEDIDNAAKLGLGHPMGPLELSDYIGNDVVLSIIKNIENKEYFEKYSDGIQTLEKLVYENKLGRKTGEGFYKR
jgi:3-hydroxybutyryl-CoA dehydrogenase